MRIAAASVALALAATGCGGGQGTLAGSTGSAQGRSGSTGPTVGPNANPSIAAKPSPPPAVTVTLARTEATTTLRVGQAVVVRPAAGRAGKAHAVVAEVGTPVLRYDGGTSSTGWRFVAGAPGTAHVVVSYGPQCVAGELCPMFRGLLARVTVVVRA